MSGEHHLDKWQKLAKSLLFCLQICVCVYIYTYIWKLATLIYFLCYLDMWTAKALELRWGKKDVTFPGRALSVWMMLEKKKVKNQHTSSQRNSSLCSWVKSDTAVSRPGSQIVCLQLKADVNLRWIWTHLTIFWEPDITGCLWLILRSLVSLLIQLPFVKSDNSSFIVQWQPAKQIKPWLYPCVMMVGWLQLLLDCGSGSVFVFGSLKYRVNA